MDDAIRIWDVICRCGSYASTCNTNHHQTSIQIIYRPSWGIVIIPTSILNAPTSTFVYVDATSMQYVWPPEVNLKYLLMINISSWWNMLNSQNVQMLEDWWNFLSGWFCTWLLQMFSSWINEINLSQIYMMCVILINRKYVIRGS